MNGLARSQTIELISTLGVVHISTHYGGRRDATTRNAFLTREPSPIFWNDPNSFCNAKLHC